jgi:hypothetical protein
MGHGQSAAVRENVRKSGGVGVVIGAKHESKKGRSCGTPREYADDVAFLDNPTNGLRTMTLPFSAGLNCQRGVR